MWKKISGILIVVGLSLGFSWGASSQASTATSQAGVTFTGQYDPSEQTPSRKTEGSEVFPSAKTKKPLSPSIVGNLPITGDTFPFGAVLLGVALIILSFLLHSSYLTKLKTRKEEKRT